jgi:hypothetical protein
MKLDPDAHPARAAESIAVAHWLELQEAAVTALLEQQQKKEPIRKVA